MAEKYDGYSPYGYSNNSPILFTDPDGREIWIGYGDDRRAQYKDGKLYNEDGSKYKGKDAFVKTVFKTLNGISSTDIGKDVVGKSSTSDNNFVYTNTSAGVGNDRTLAFQENANEGGEIHASALMNNKITEGQKFESSAHELFHGFQFENGEKGATVNREVGAYLFGKAVSLTLGYGISNFGSMNTKVGSAYDNAMTALMYGNSFNQSLYNQAVRSFKLGSIANNGDSQGVYNKFIVKPNDTNPVIKKFFPLVR